MASIRIIQFGGLLPEVNTRLRPITHAQIAHNCLLLDGALRPYPKWRALEEYTPVSGGDALSVMYNESIDRAVFSSMEDAVLVDGAPFASTTYVGTVGANGVYYVSESSSSNRKVDIFPDGLTGSVSYTRSYDSIKPVNRIYAVSRVRTIGNRAEEGPLILLGGQSPTDILYEGDLVSITLTNSTFDDGITHVRIYRSVTGLDTGQAITNELDTNWHLVGEIPIGIVSGGEVYVDGDSATALPFDMYYANTFHGPRLQAKFFGLTESGWFIAGAEDGTIAISERYMHHAWPVDNYLKVPKIVDMAVFMDNVYVGTNSRPYIIAVSSGDKPMQASAVPYAESVPCLPGTMTPSASGAMYASASGIVSLSRDGMRMITKDTVNGDEILYTRKTVDENDEEVVVTAKVGISLTVFGHYWKGQYFGFVTNPTYEFLDVGEIPPALGYVFNTGSDAVDNTQFQRLVTIDGPTRFTPASAANGRQGIYLMASINASSETIDQNAYVLPVPGSGSDQGYADAPKMEYRWKSKRFVMPGRTTFGAIKVVHDKGCIRVKIYLAGCCIYDAVVQGCSPFRLPSQYAGIDWEIELVGNATVYEVHMASTMQELTRVENG